jgi:cytochrome c-type biogenesis protein CcmH/NrfF
MHSKSMDCNRLDSSGNVALWLGPGMTTIIWTVVTFSKIDRERHKPLERVERVYVRFYL